MSLSQTIRKFITKYTFSIRSIRKIHKNPRFLDFFFCQTSFSSLQLSKYPTQIIIANNMSDGKKANAKRNNEKSSNKQR